MLKLDKKIEELETYWSGTFETWGVPALLTGAKMLAAGQDAGFDSAFLRPATAVLMLREVQRRWKAETDSDIRAAVLAEAETTDAGGER